MQLFQLKRSWEIDEGKINYETKIIENNPDEIIKQLAQLTTDTAYCIPNELATCLAPGGIKFSYNYFFDIEESSGDTKKGEHRGIR